MAQQLGSPVRFISVLRHGAPYQLPLRYLVQSLQTLKLLNSDRPDVIFVQNPPIFAALLIYIYARARHRHFVIDSHTGAFTPPWSTTLWLHRILSRTALVTLVHNDRQAGIVSAWGARHLVLPDYPGPACGSTDYPLSGRFNAAVISSWSSDEPIDVVFQAARRSTDTHFYVTGDATRIDSKLLAVKPDNVHLTGYLSYEKYLGLLGRADVVIALTTRDNTLLSGANEAVSLGTPLITSDWPVLREQFSRGVIHVGNTVESLHQGLALAMSRQADLRREILELRDQLLVEWNQQFTTLTELIASSNTRRDCTSVSA